MSIGSYLKSLKDKMVRDPLSPERVAAGWALGMFVGCSIPFGFQLIISVPIAILLKVSKVGASVGTLITNPITIWIIYPIQTWAMHHVIFGETLNFGELMALRWTWHTVRQLGFETMTSFFLGGIVLAVMFTPITYFAVLGIVRRYRKMI